MSPLEIEILLHYHCRASDYRGAEYPPQAQKDIFKYFLASGFLVENSDYVHDGKPPKYRSTDKLDAYCEALCRVKEPKQVWITD